MLPINVASGRMTLSPRRSGFARSTNGLDAHLKFTEFKLSFTDTNRYDQSVCFFALLINLCALHNTESEAFVRGFVQERISPAFRAHPCAATSQLDLHKAATAWA